MGILTVISATASNSFPSESERKHHGNKESILKSLEVLHEYSPYGIMKCKNVNPSSVRTMLNAWYTVGLISKFEKKWLERHFTNSIQKRKREAY